ncbi:MAG: hypothetical protein A2Y54_07390 [Chloroflexi bacterium RBG_16_51_16]|nr:MAG: hypothetical protein A2Y54_07390 [Chloroflexi bacterium RBG_16_51_16]
MKNRLTISISLTLALIFAQVGVVLAAPSALEGDISGNVTDVQVDDTTDPDTVLVTVDDGLGGIQTVRILATDAVTLGLVTIDEFGVATPVDPLPTDPKTISGTQIIPDAGAGEEEVTHPVALALASFFGIAPEEIMMVHEQGVCEGTTSDETGTEGALPTGEGECDSHSIGFGLIAQSLWMANDLEGEFAWQDILLAKQEKDFTPLGAPEDVTNWGQFKKYVKESQVDPDKGHNLGGVMSGQEDPVASEAPETLVEGASTPGVTGSGESLLLTTEDQQTNPGQGNNKNNNNHKGGNGKGKGKNK